eukprot:2307687-Amphidinium_carterae.1
MAMVPTVSASAPLRLSQFATTPAAGLGQFLHKHGRALTEHSRSLLESALSSAGHPVMRFEEQTPMRVSIATPREANEMDLDTQLDSLSPPPPTPQLATPDEGVQGQEADVHQARDQ